MAGGMWGGDTMVLLCVLFCFRLSRCRRIGDGGRCGPGRGLAGRGGIGSWGCGSGCGSRGRVGLVSLVDLMGDVGTPGAGDGGLPLSGALGGVAFPAEEGGPDGSGPSEVAGGAGGEGCGEASHGMVPQTQSMVRVLQFEHLSTKSRV